MSPAFALLPTLWDSWTSLWPSFGIAPMLPRHFCILLSRTDQKLTLSTTIIRSSSNLAQYSAKTLRPQSSVLRTSSRRHVWSSLVDTAVKRSHRRIHLASQGLPIFPDWISQLSIPFSTLSCSPTSRHDVDYSGCCRHNNASDAAKASASSAAASLSKAIVSASAALSSEKAIASGNEANPPVFKYVGLALAVASGFLIGSSFVFKKKGLLASQKKYETAAGEGHSYLKSPMWWTGMMVMVLGEVCNLVAYAFADAVLVTPLGALSVVICAVLSSIFLKEKLTLFGKVGCFLCIVGSVIIALNAPTQHAGGKITEFEKLFIAPGFLSWASICVVASLVLVFYFGPRYGKKHMLVYIGVCSLIGGLSVSVTSGLGSAILLSIRGQNQFKHWFIYFLLGFVIVTLLIEINYLNKALELFNTATVTPTYYVLFTGCTLITSIILQQGLEASPIDIVTLVMGFLVICSGIVLLQLSKIDPEELLEDRPGLDRNTTLLIRASHSVVSHGEKAETSAYEDPGVDAVRGGMGIVGSMIRARSSRRLSSASSWRHHSAADEYTLRSRNNLPLTTHGVGDIERYQLQDTPLSPRGMSRDNSAMTLPSPVRRETTISFASGADSPHGHHDPGAGRESIHHTAPPISQFGAAAAGLQSIRESSQGSGKSSDIGAVRSNNLYVDPYAPTNTSPLSPRFPRSDGAPDLRNMWAESGYSSSTGKTPETETEDDEQYSIRAVAASSANPNDAREGSVRSKKSFPTIKPRTASRSRTRTRSHETSDDEQEAEELLSPRVGYR
ncbi:DUF803-domain-containing protein [Testicularia cyperi]|uniref:DUF803-domain-containing protein n=1 Tax=Testicularia cyperi TaxID=1882483 RepID=A0A317XL89_9BASI|nr:DUF803-domain-containing protein [Testicularia cyperi]